MTHTILLWQPERRETSRTWKDFPNVAAACDYIINIFETRLQARRLGKQPEMNPQLRDITYDLNDLYAYIDTLQDMCALVLHQAAYVPRTKDWIKQEVHAHLSRQVGGNASGRRGTRRR